MMWKKILRIIAIIIMIIAIIFCIFAVLAWAEIPFALYIPSSLAFIGTMSPAALLAVAALGGVLANIVSKDGAQTVMNGVSTAVTSTATQVGTVAGGIVSGVGAAAAGLLTNNFPLLVLGVGIVALLLFKKKSVGESDVAVASASERARDYNSKELSHA